MIVDMRVNFKSVIGIFLLDFLNVIFLKLMVVNVMNKMYSVLI